MKKSLNELSLDTYKVCFECNRKQNIKYTYHRNKKEKIIFYKREEIDPSHERCVELTELKNELKLIEVVLKAKQQEITDKEYEIFLQK